jgi:thiosulfate dehydrogenase [quinone] large subunit
MDSNIVTRKGAVVEEPAVVKLLLNDIRASWLWLILRVWLGWQWIEAAQYKFFDPAWFQTGSAVKEFWEAAIAIPDTGRPAIAFDWYRLFIQALLEAEAYTWFAPFVAYAELLVGIALVLGAFTGIAAFFGGLLNWNFMMAGSASSNPMLFMIAVGLMLAWKVAGYVGLDYYLLPWLGTPWRSASKEWSEPRPMVIRA